MIFKDIRKYYRDENAMIRFFTEAYQHSTHIIEEIHKNNLKNLFTTKQRTLENDETTVAKDIESAFGERPRQLIRLKPRNPEEEDKYKVFYGLPFAFVLSNPKDETDLGYKIDNTQVEILEMYGNNFGDDFHTIYCPSSRFDYRGFELTLYINEFDSDATVKFSGSVISYNDQNKNFYDNLKDGNLLKIIFGPYLLSYESGSDYIEFVVSEKYFEK